MARFSGILQRFLTVVIGIILCTQTGSSTRAKKISKTDKFWMFARGIASALFSGIFAVSFLTPAYAQSKKSMWGQSHLTDLWRPSASEACEELGLTVIPGLFYDGQFFDRSVPESEKYERTCVDTYGKTTWIKMYCADLDANENVTGWNAGLCPKKCQTCSTSEDEAANSKVANPIDLRSGVKIERSDDWVSPRESRFRIARHFRSDGSLNDLLPNSISLSAHPGSWRTEFNDSLTQEGSRNIFRSHTGNVIEFPDTAPYAPIHPGSDATLESLGNNIWRLQDGTSKTLTFGSDPAKRPLEKVTWDDGYEIDILRSAPAGGNPRISAITDNRGNRAEYAWASLYEDTLSTYKFSIPESLLRDGNDNRIEFRRISDPVETWGLTNFLIEPDGLDLQSDISLTLGVADSGDYGYNFLGNYDSTGPIAEFISTGEDLALTLRSYDMDLANEVEIFVNGMSLGVLSPSHNNGYKENRLVIPSDWQVSGKKNFIEFRFIGTQGWIWGITDIKIETHLTEMTLVPGVEDTQSFGYNFAGKLDLYGPSATFVSTASPMLLTFRTYDMDYADELEVLLNGKSLGAVSGGGNEAYLSHSFPIQGSEQVAGDNLIEFRYIGKPNWKWGITDVEIDHDAAPTPPASPDMSLTAGVMDTGSWGNNFQGNSDTTGPFAVFTSSAQDMVLELQAWDMDLANEIEIFINGHSYGILPGGSDNAFSSHSIYIEKEDQFSGANVIEFRYIGSPLWTWGMTDVVLNVAPPLITPDITLSEGVTDTSSFGYGFQGHQDTSGPVAEFSYSNTGAVLKFQAYDMDNSGEIEILVNGTSIGALPQIAYSQTILKKIEVDSDYDGSTFDPELSIDYAYEPNLTLEDYPVLSSVSRTDLVTQVGETIYSYTYEKEPNINGTMVHTYPILLSGIKDGRLDANGDPFDYARFEYNMDADFVQFGGSDQSYRPAIVSEHFGGADRYVVGDGVVTNPLGLVKQYGFQQVDTRTLINSVDELASGTVPATTTSYDFTPNTGAPAGFVYGRTEKNGALTTFERDSQGRVLTKTEDANGISPRVTTYTWHADQRLPETITTTKLQQSFSYDASDLLTSLTLTDVDLSSPSNGATRTWTYNYTTLPSGLRVLATIDGPGLASASVTDVTSYSYNDDGTLASVTDPNGLVTTYGTYGAGGLPTEVTYPDGQLWSFTYDIMGRPLSATRDPLGDAATTAYTYDVVGQMTSYTTAEGNTWSFDYDEARRLIKTTAPNGDTAQYQHDAMGNITVTEHSDSQSTVHFREDLAYDALGRLSQRIGAEGQQWSHTYDLQGNPDLITDPLSKTIDNTYDALNRLAEVVDKAGHTTFMAHDSSDDLTTYTDPRAIETDFVRNGFGEVIQEISADRGTISYSYNSRGLVASMTDARGIVANYEYDNGGRLTAKRFPSDPALDQTFTYDVPRNAGANTFGTGRIGTVADASGQTDTTYAPDGSVAEITQQIEGINNTTLYELDDDGRLLWLEYPSARRVQFTYDVNDQITGVSTRMQVIDPGTGQYPPWETVTSAATYIPMGPLSAMDYGDGAHHSRSYDQSNRLTGLSDTLGLTTLRDKTLSYTLRDDIAAITDALNPAQGENFLYENRGFLSEADGPYSKLNFTYDAVGNRLTLDLTVSGTTTTDTYSYPLTSNRLQSVAGGMARTFTYDAAGNVTYDNRSGIGYGYTYDAANRMESMSINGVVQAEYEYNALGQQVIRRLTQTGQTIHNVFDMDGNRIAEYDYDAATNTATLIREYVWMDGTPVAVVEGGQVYYIRTDHIGRPILATDSTGTKVWEASYLPFGGVHTSSGANIDLRFPGQWFQSESALHQNWMRDYDPATGRYIQTDPLGLVDGASVYGYALQNPGKYIDPKGEETVVSITIPPNWNPLEPGHASLFLPDIIYDPSGSCSCQFNEDGGPYPPGSGQTYSRNPKTDQSFRQYQRSDGWIVQEYSFPTTKHDEQRIRERIEKLGGGGAFDCANFVSRAISGIGPFSKIRQTSWPKKLQRQLRQTGPYRMGP